MIDLPERFERAKTRTLKALGFGACLLSEAVEHADRALYLNLTGEGRKEKKHLRARCANMEQETSDIRMAVQSILLPALKEESRALAASILRGVINDPVVLFVAVDCMSGLLERAVRHATTAAERAAALIVMKADGSLSLGDRTLLEPGVITDEIRRFAGERFALTDEGSRQLTTWALQALRDLPQLLPDYDAKTGDGGETILTPAEREKDFRYLARRWSNGSMGTSPAAAPPPSPAI